MEHVWSAEKFLEVSERAKANPDTRKISMFESPTEPPNPVLQEIDAEIRQIETAKQRLMLEQMVEMAKFKIALEIAKAARYSRRIKSAIQFLYSGPDYEIDPIKEELHLRIREILEEFAQTKGYKITYDTRVEYCPGIGVPGKEMEITTFVLECRS